MPQTSCKVASFGQHLLGECGSVQRARDIREKCCVPRVGLKGWGPGVAAEQQSTDAPMLVVVDAVTLL